ncbi:MAG TPA: Ger(x)C family spore germination protein [Firmicutes bacterium]|jgi:spore germination protein KC|nr:Ger(x)C family spore germination protein [Bacillota bacterium]
MRRWFLALLSLMLLTSQMCLCGCWDRREINELAVVSSLGIDKEDDIWKITAEIFRPTTGGGEDGSSGGGGSGGGGTRRQVWIAQGQGYTLLGALRDMALKVPRRVYVAHTSAILVGEEVSRQGILEFLDLWERNAEARIITNLLVCRGKAEDVLMGSQGSLEKSVGLELAGLKLFSPVNGHSTLLSVHEFSSLLEAKGADPFTGVAELRPVPTMPTAGGKSSGSAGVEEMKTKETTLALRLKGLALFRDDKLVGFAEPTEARGILTLQGKITNTVVYAKATADQKREDNTVALKVFTARRQIKVEEKEGRPVLKIKITAEIALAEQAYRGDLMQADDYLFLEQQAATVIKNEAEQAIQLAKRLGVDPFSFGEIIRRQNKKLWQKLEKKWPEALQDLEISIDTRAKVRRSGLTGVPPLEKR